MSIFKTQLVRRSDGLWAVRKSFLGIPVVYHSMYSNRWWFNTKENGSFIWSGSYSAGCLFEKLKKSRANRFEKFVIEVKEEF